MISKHELATLKTNLETLVVKDINATILAFREALPANSPILEQLLSLEGRHHDNVNKTIENTIKPDDAEIVTSQVRSGLITLISSLEPKDFEKQKPPGTVVASKKYLPYLLFLLLGLGVAIIASFVFGSGGEGGWFDMPQGRTGHLLYKIPQEMQVGTETECVVRIAFDDLTILRDLMVDEVEIKTIGTSERMKVELLNSGSDAIFNIHNVLGDDEQFIVEDNYTEWKYAVKPLREGAHKLILKVSLMTKSGDDYLPSNISYSQDVEITTKPVFSKPLAFHKSGQIVSMSSEMALASQVDVARAEYTNSQQPDSDKLDKGLLKSISELKINFAYNSTEFQSSDDAVGELLKLLGLIENHSTTVVITGHTDNYGEERYNLKLGLRRAEKIADLFLRNGFSKNSVRIETAGENDPVAPNATKQGRLANRRVTISMAD